jgi:hypothetical protein
VASVLGLNDWEQSSQGIRFWRSASQAAWALLLAPSFACAFLMWLGAPYRLKLFDHVQVAESVIRVCTAEFGALPSILRGLCTDL